MKSYHFRGTWKNGDKLVICSYGKNKQDAFFNILKAKKQKKFKHREKDNFVVSKITNEETYTRLRRKGVNHFDANILSVYGHTAYIVKDNKVTIN